MRGFASLPKLVSFIAPLLGIALWIGCTSSSNLPGSDASWSAAGGTTGGHGAGNGGNGGRGGVAGTGGAGGTGGHAMASLDAGIDRRPSASDAGIDRYFASDAQSCTDGGAFICVPCGTDVGFRSAVCSQAIWACPGGWAASFSQCPPCSAIPPLGCTCNPSSGVTTCPHDAAAVDRPPGQ